MRERKPRLHIHSDSPFFSGSENMVANFLLSPEVAEAFDVSFTYRASPAYAEGLARRVPDLTGASGLDLLDVPAWTDPIEPRWLRTAAKAACHLLGVKYWFLLANVRRMDAALQGRGIDILHVNSGGYPGAYSCVASVLAARGAGIRTVVFVANNLATGYRHPRRWLDFPFDRFVAHRVTRFVSGSVAAAESLREVLLLPDERVEVLHNGIAPRPVAVGAAEVRARLGAHLGRVLVGVVANFEARKGHRVLVEALSRLAEDGWPGEPPLVVLEGEGPTRAAVEEQVRAAGLDGVVVFPGRVDDVFSLMGACDVLALPSVGGEDFPNVVLEGMSLGKAIVASRVAGTPEQIDDGRTGVLVEPRDAAGLASALRALLADSPLRVRLGAAARDEFERRFTAETAVHRYVESWRALSGVPLG